MLQCHRVLGDLDALRLRSGQAEAGDYESARAHYDQALKIARSITMRDVLIEALLARGRCCQTSEVSETSEVSTAFSDLNEALGYAVEGGYRRYEADIRVALAWAHLAEAKVPPLEGEGFREGSARREAERAQQMSVEMGYHWGQVDAAEVLAAVDE